MVELGLTVLLVKSFILVLYQIASDTATRSQS